MLLSSLRFDGTLRLTMGVEEMLLSSLRRPCVGHPSLPDTTWRRYLGSTSAQVRGIFAIGAL